MERKNVAIVAFIVSIFIIFFSTSWKILYEIPNLVEISDSQSVINLLASIIAALSSILGIIVAILLVAFQILRKTYATYAVRDVFDNTSLLSLFTLFVMTIIVSSISLAGIENPLSIRNINLSYVSFFSFTICLAVLYPLSKNIISSVRSKTRIKDIVSEIDKEKISQLFDQSHHIRPRIPEPSKQMSVLEENPLYLLSEISIRAIKEDDRLLPKMILYESTNRLVFLIGKEVKSKGDIRLLIRAFLIIIENSASQAIRQRKQSVLRSIFTVIREIHLFCASKKIVWHELIELNNTLNEIIEKAIKKDMEDAALSGFYTIGDICKAHLQTNIPEQEELWMLHFSLGKKKNLPADTDKDLQWKAVSDGFPDMAFSLSKKAIELGKANIVNNGLFCLYTIISSTANIELGNLQKEYIISKCYLHSERILLKCADKNLYGRLSPSFPFSHTLILRILSKNLSFSKIPIIRFCETLIKLAEKEFFDPFLLNELGTIGRHSITKIKGNNIYTKSLLFICDSLNEIRKILEKEEPIISKSYYLELYKQVKSFEKWMEKENKSHQSAYEKISQLLIQFKDIESLGDNQGIIEWPH